MFGAHGVTPIELSYLFAMWAGIALVSEVPSGALADTFSRKWLIVSSALFKALAFLSWFFWQDFWGYALGFALWGIGSSLRSGAWEALLHDTLQEQNQASEFTRHYGRIEALAAFGVAAGELSGGFLIVNGYSFVLLLSALVPIVATLPFIFWVSDVEKSEDVYEKGYMDNLLAGLKEAVGNRSILYILMTSMLLLMSYGVLDEFLGPLLQAAGFSLSHIAFLTAPILLAQAAGQALAHRFTHWTKHQLLLCMGGAALISLSASMSIGLLLPFLVAVFFAVFGFASTLYASFLQEEIESDSRATVTSIVGFGEGVGAILWFLVFGLMAEIGSMIQALTGLSILILIICGLLMALGRYWKIDV